ncbi:glycoside hydrolase family 3 N-terminal domain-containing protein [Altererythrobacter sp. ZODW24]|uniref:glycoside hydrolase family 3 N-terminal domain-containing protein n=1 Tax=Altererythrobacter sp. ZODW24 TaxID=2185142 RepID=UPI000DF81668|nr:glycoside hydrolase family 3 N-terminal domain-containing protein [Altererythrobacter sp. ZODW24]
MKIIRPAALSASLSIIALTIASAASAQDQDPGPLPSHVTNAASSMDLPEAVPTKASPRVENLLRQMTLEEKVGQLTQAAGGRSKTLNSKLTLEELDRVRAGKAGSYLHVAGAEPLRELQRVAVEESRLKIPLLFAMDVVHGYRTIFPVPIAIAASWEPEAWEQTARISAVEASNSGLHWTFAPMVDIARDPRWGRVVEGAGEDAYLGSIMAAAQVRGYQGTSLKGSGTMMATTKHFGAYGAPLGGRDYGTAEISERALHEIYLPPFYAAMKAGTGSYMTAFNDVGGQPTTGNAELINGTLRGQWGFDGMLVSDWNAIAELINHGVAGSRADAGALAVSAGVDMDMMSLVYSDDLTKAAAANPDLVAHIDNAVRNVLTAKERLGLFDDPMAYHNVVAEAESIRSAAHIEAARDIAERSMVLLKNSNNALPLAAKAQKIAVIGAMAIDTQSQLGSWRARGDKAEVVSILEGITQGAPDGASVTFTAGAAPQSHDETGIAAAVTAAMDSDVVLLVIGEDYDLSGEARSRSSLDLPPSQLALAKAVFAAGKPVMVLLTGGRPLAIPELDEQADAILMTWLLGNEAGPAVANIVFGKTAPGGKLPIAFPRTTGAVPYSYGEYPAGRPAHPDPIKDSNRFKDLPITQLYPFGHGLSYGDVTMTDLGLSSPTLQPGGNIEISVKLTNRGPQAGYETAQLYLRDVVSRQAQPKMTLRGFKRVMLQPGESRTVTFTLTPDQLTYYGSDGKWRTEGGRFDVMIGASAEDIRQRGSFTLSVGLESDIPAAALATETAVR